MATPTPESDEALDLGAIDPGEVQAWNETFARVQRASAEFNAAFERKVEDGSRRYNNDPVFHAKVHLLAKIVFDKRSRAIFDAIRAVVAMEEMDGGVLDLRL